MLGAVLAVVGGLAVNAVPTSWRWAHDWVLLWSVTGLVALALVVVAILQAHSQAGRNLGLAKVADKLAEAVSRQWVPEAAARGLSDPYPLPVSWHAADASLADDWGVRPSPDDGKVVWCRLDMHRVGPIGF